MFRKTEPTRLGEILVAKGLITPEQLAIATREQTKRNRLLNVTDTKVQRGVLIGEILVEFGFIDQLELKRGLNWQQRLRHVSIAMALCAPFMAFAPASASAQVVSSSSKSSSASTNFVPVIIQAENYASMSGVWNESTTDVGGGKDTGNINTGDWMSYTNTPVQIPVTGTYKITYRVASLNTAGKLALREASTEAKLDTATIPITGGWQTWVDVTRTITLTQGTHSFKIFAEAGGFNLNWFKIEMVAPAAATSSTTTSANSSSRASSQAATTGAASNTNASQSSVASNAPAPSSSSARSTTSVASSANSSAAYASPPWIIQAEAYSSMSGIWNETTTDVGGGQNAGNINTGDWMSYTNTKVSVPTTGTYKITMRVASQSTAGSLQFKDEGSGSLLDTIPIPVTGGWQTWTDVTRTITLTQGLHSFKLIAAVGGFNLNWFKIEPVGGQQPLTIQAENYSAMKGVWNESTADVGGGQDTGNIDALDWMVYYNVDVNVPSSGSYKMTYRVASLNGGASFTLNEAGTTTVYDTVPVGKTGGWQTWTNVERVITLPAGKHHFGINALVGGFNLNWFKLEPLSNSSSSAVGNTSSSTSTSNTSSNASSVISKASSSSAPSSVSSSTGGGLVSGISTLVKGLVNLNWMSPNQRENGKYLDVTEIGGYEIRYKLKSAENFTYITLNDAWADRYSFPWLEGEYIFQIAAFDKNGIYSNFTDLIPK